MVNRYYRKPHQFKKKKPFLKKRFLVFGFLALILAGGAFYCLFLLNAFWVDEIIVSGQKKVSREAIEFLASGRLDNKALFFQTKSIFSVDTGQIEKDILDAFPQIAEAQVKKSFFDAVKIAVVEREPSAVWCQDAKCFFIDETGIIFEEASLNTDLLLIDNLGPAVEAVPGARAVSEEKLGQIFKINSGLVKTAGLSAKRAVLASEDRLNIETSEGWEVYFNLRGDLDWQLTELVLVLEKQISPEKRRNLEYIDLRFNRVFYK